MPEVRDAVLAHLEDATAHSDTSPAEHSFPDNDTDSSRDDAEEDRWTDPDDFEWGDPF